MVVPVGPEPLGSVTLNAGEYITAITNDSSGNSSEFSNYAVATDSDAGGATPSDLQAVATTEGGLTLNNDGGNDAYLVADDSPFSGQTATTIEVEFRPLPPQPGSRRSFPTRIRRTRMSCSSGSMQRAN